MYLVVIIIFVPSPIFAPFGIWIHVCGQDQAVAQRLPILILYKLIQTFRNVRQCLVPAIKAAL